MADIWSADYYNEVTPADNTNVDFAHNAIYCGDAGDVAVRQVAGGSVVVFTVPAGGLLPIKVYSIDATNTTCTNIVLLR